MKKAYKLQSLHESYETHFYSNLVPDRIDDGDVALQRSDENSVSRRHQEIPEGPSCEPDATQELVPSAVSWHTSAVHLDNCRQQSEEGRTHVRDALIHDQNVYRLNTYDKETAYANYHTIHIHVRVAMIFGH